MQVHRLLAIPLLAVFLLVGGCANMFGGDTPPQQAYALNKEYQAVAHVALACLQQEACKDLAGDAIKAADNVAFAYVAQVTAEAKAWDLAPDDQKDAEASGFDKLFSLARSAVTALSDIIHAKTGG